MRVTHFRQLDVWRLAMRLVREVYMITKTFPDSQRYVLTSQIQRSAISIPSNIAEGNGRASRKDYARFVSNALGSCAELQTQLLLAEDLEFATDGELTSTLDLCERVGSMLQRLHQALLRSPSPESRVPSPEQDA